MEQHPRGARPGRAFALLCQKMFAFLCDAILVVLWFWIIWWSDHGDELGLCQSSTFSDFLLSFILTKCPRALRCQTKQKMNVDVPDSQLPNLSGQACPSMGKSTSFMGHSALMVNLWRHRQTLCQGSGRTSFRPTLPAPAAEVGE